MIAEVMSGGWSATAVGTDSGATATKAAVSGKAHVVTHVSGHVDEDATLQLRGGSTVLAEWKVDVSVEGIAFKIPPGTWPCAPGVAANLVLANSDADAQVNMCGFTIP